MAGLIPRHRPSFGCAGERPSRGLGGGGVWYVSRRCGGRLVVFWDHGNGAERRSHGCGADLSRYKALFIPRLGLRYDRHSLMCVTVWGRCLGLEMWSVHGGKVKYGCSISGYMLKVVNSVIRHDSHLPIPIPTPINTNTNTDTPFTPT